MFESAMVVNLISSVGEGRKCAQLLCLHSDPLRIDPVIAPAATLGSALHGKLEKSFKRRAESWPGAGIARLHTMAVLSLLTKPYSLSDVLPAALIFHFTTLRSNN